MPSAATLTTLRDRVEQFLDDPTNLVFDVSTLQESVQLALDEYNLARPLGVIGTITLAAAGREIALTTLTGLQRIERVWSPYKATDDEPNWRKYEQWDNAGVYSLYVTDGDEPASGDVVRVFYSKPHTLSGLNGAVATTFPAEDESLVVLAAAGYACHQRAVDLNEDTTQNALAVPNYRELGDVFLKRFRGLLDHSLPDNPG
jgi:hypothetical protein